MGALGLFLGFPTFCLAVLCMYWSAQLLTLLGYARPLQLTGARNDPWSWALGFKTLFKVRVLKINAQEVYRGPKPVVFLCNHRSWTDFFMDVYMTEGRGMMLSRLAVLYVFPWVLPAVRCVRGVLLFKRGRIADKDAFNAWIDREVAASPHGGIIVYPEGHRSTRPASLPLKRGMLYYAHSRKLPVQVVHSVNKELMLSEKELTARFGVTMAVAHSAVLDAGDYAAPDDFLAAVQRTWDETWALAYSADLAGLPEFVPQPLAAHPPLAGRLGFLAVTAAGFAALAATLAATAWVAAAFLRLFPPTAQAVIVAATLLWWAAAYVHTHAEPPVGAGKAAPRAEAANGSVAKKQR